MSTEHRPRIWFGYGNWHCNLPWPYYRWPQGIGATPFEAFEDWEHRWKLERSR